MIVRSLSPIIVLTTLFYLVDSALGGLFSRENAASTLKVLTGTAPNACTLPQVAAIKERLAEAVILAEDASKALKVKGVETSDSFRSFLGNAKPDKMDAQHYSPVASLRNVVLESVTSDIGHAAGKKATAPATETLFKCYDASNENCSLKGEPPGKAQGTYAITNRNDHTVNFCPMFFEKTGTYDQSGQALLPSEPLSLAAGKAGYLAANNALFKINGVIYFMPAVVLLHEFQHASSVVGDNFVPDLFVKKDAQHIVVPAPKSPDDGIMAAYPTQACIAIPADKKRENAQNLAVFALDVYADPNRGLPQASGVVNAGQTGSKTPKRFEAIHRRGFEQKAAFEKHIS